MKWLKPISICLFLLAIVLAPLSAQGGDLFNGGPHLKPESQAIHRTIIGEVQKINRGLVYVKTQEGTTRSFPIEEAKKEGIPWIQKGDLLTLEIDEGNLIIDIHKQEAVAKTIESAGRRAAGHHHQILRGALDSFDPLGKKVSLRLDSGETRAFEVKVPVLTKLNGVQPGTRVALEVDEEGRVMDAHRG